MAAYDFSAPRLFVEGALHAGARIALSPPQAHYLLHVLRLKPGGGVLAFNGVDGEWRASLAMEGRKTAALVAEERLREQTAPGDLLYLFAPLKHARLDYLVQKAVEMGAGALQPVITERTQGTRLNRERMRANLVEAAEQCGILALPTMLPEGKLPAVLAALEPDRLLVFCDEEAPVSGALEALAAARNSSGKVAVIIGPEGGFTDPERALVLRHSRVARVSLGPRILRADTAAVAALALVQAVLGDWR